MLHRFIALVFVLSSTLLVGEISRGSGYWNRNSEKSLASRLAEQLFHPGRTAAAEAGA